jgi:hypothetical protein
MTKEQVNQLGKFSSPIYQALATLSGILAVDVLTFLAKLAGLKVESDFLWLTTASFMLVFAMFNSIIALSAPSILRYWTQSIYSFIILCATSGALAYFLSGSGKSDGEANWWVFIIVTFGYLVFFSIMVSIRSIVTFAQREEWSQPRFRQRKRK